MMKKVKTIMKSALRVLVSVLIGVAAGLVFSELRSASRFDGYLFILEFAVAFVIAYFANIIIHEGGHLVCGLISG